MKKGLMIALAMAVLLTGCGFFTADITASVEKESLAVSEGQAKEDAEARQALEEPEKDGIPQTLEEPEKDGVPQALEESEKDGGGQVSQVSEETRPGQSAEPEIALVMVGDILLHTPVAESGKTEDGGYDFTPIFAQVKEEIEEADIAIVNQEVIIGGEELGVSGYPAFNAPYELGDALADAGFDVVCQATNHALDKGKRGILNCLAFWGERYPDMAVLGIHDSEAGRSELYVYEREGIRIAILNYTYGTNGIALPADMPYAVDLLDRERVEADLQRADDAADFVIVCPHWGTEYVLEQTAEQESWASFFAENGADLVLGTHPHVIEPVEWVEDTLVYYSLGNFVNWTSGTGDGVANRMVGGMAQVTLGRNEEGEVCITGYGVEPVVCHLEPGFGGVTVYPLAEYTEELAEKNEIVKQDASFSLEYCRELAERVFGDVGDGMAGSGSVDAAGGSAGSGTRDGSRESAETGGKGK